MQLYKGGKEFNCLLKPQAPNLVPVDFAGHAKSMGADGEHVNSIAELEVAFKEAKNQKNLRNINSYRWISMVRRIRLLGKPYSWNIFN